MKGTDTILLIEDNQADVVLMKLALERLKVPCRVVSVRDGQEALEYLEGCGPSFDRAQSPFPQLILLDLRMPRMDGFEFLQWLRLSPLLRHLPVIVITGSPLSYDVTRAYRAGANSFLVKSVDLSQFTAELGQTLSYWLLGDERSQHSTRAPVPPPADGPPIDPGT